MLSSTIRPKSGQKCGVTPCHRSLMLCDYIKMLNHKRRTLWTANNSTTLMILLSELGSEVFPVVGMLTSKEKQSTKSSCPHVPGVHDDSCVHSCVQQQNILRALLMAETFWSWLKRLQ